MNQQSAPSLLRLGLPKGRMQEGVFKLLGDAGITLRAGARGYRPTISLPDTEVKILKPQNLIEMLHHGSRDLGFAGGDWVHELGMNVVEVLDTRLDPVRLVAAAPEALLVDGKLPKRKLVVATEYVKITREWIARTGLDATVLRSYGATEVFPPEDADLIVDNTATGSTLAANGLVIIDDLMTSSTRLYASPVAMDHPKKRAIIDDITLLVTSVLQARRRVMVEVNVSAERLDAVTAILPCMREPTIASLHHGAGFAVKVAVPREDLPKLIPAIKAAGGTDIIVTALSQIVP